MPDRRPIGDLDMLHPSDTNMYLNKQKVYQISMFKYTYVEILIGLRRNVVLRWPGLHRHVGLRWVMSVSDEACLSPMGLVGVRWVSDEPCRSFIAQVGLRWVYDQACRSLMGYVGLR